MRKAILVLSLALLATAQAQAAEPRALRESCGVLIAEETGSRVVGVPGYSILDSSSPLRPPEEHPIILGVLCDRSDFGIADNDYRVLTELGVPFYLSAGEVTIVLEISNGQLRVRNIRGELTEAQLQLVQRALNRNQSIMQGDPP
jgi:hypothetical protein